MKRVAIPIANNKLSEYFGGCSHYMIYEIGKSGISETLAEMPDGIAVADLPGWIEKQGITDLIAYKVNREIIKLFASRKVNLFVGIQINDPEKLIDDYLNGKLESDKNIIQQLMSD